MMGIKVAHYQGFGRELLKKEKKVRGICLISRRNVYVSNFNATDVEELCFDWMIYCAREFYEVNMLAEKGGETATIYRPVFVYGYVAGDSG